MFRKSCQYEYPCHCEQPEDILVPMSGNQKTLPVSGISGMSSTSHVFTPARGNITIGVLCIYDTQADFPSSYTNNNTGRPVEHTSDIRSLV